MFAAGAVIAGYRVERVLGTGGMGAVYLVDNPELPRRDALKVLSAELSRDPNFRARFTREADVASQLDHPNIVSIYRRGETPDGQLWIAMQFIDGVNADEALESGPMNPQRAVRIVGEVGKALDYGHRRGVIHRDVKPANVLLSNPVDGVERVLLADFGIARALDDVGLTGTGGVMTTVSYAAPEVISGGRVDGRADLYSLGCTLFRLLSGRSPFDGVGAQVAVMMAHLQTPPPRVSAVAPWLPPALDAVLIKALAKDPAHRFASGVELAAAAGAALQSPTGPAGPGGPPQQPVLQQFAAPMPGQPPQPAIQRFAGAAPQPGPTRRGRGPLLAVALATVVLLLAGVLTTVVLTRGSGRTDATAESSAGITPTTATPATATPSTATPTAAESTPAQPAAAVPIAALAEVLLSPAELTAALGAPPLTVLQDQSAMWSDTIVDKDCDSVVMVNGQSDYAGSGYTAIRWQGLKDNADDWSWDVGQAVVSFPRAQDATTYVDRAAEVWKRCANRTINTRASKDTSPDVFWSIGPVSDADGIVSTTRVPQTGGSWMCQEGLSASNNVVIRVWVCRPDADMLLVRKFTDAIAAKVDARS
ncbi:MAG TPA: serine/threonine-protein kinase PknH/PknJ [Mycobacterium sp.]|nr:serine/threonine-protein kinase PknH/PknJ [Mycobacterium sp.]